MCTEKIAALIRVLSWLGKIIPALFGEIIQLAKFENKNSTLECRVGVNKLIACGININRMWKYLIFQRKHGCHVIGGYEVPKRSASSRCGDWLLPCGFRRRIGHLSWLSAETESRIIAVRARLPTHVHIALSCARATTHGEPLASSSAIRKIDRCRTVRVHGVERGMNSFRYRTQSGAFLERSRTRSRNHQGPGGGCRSDGNLGGNEHFERTACRFCLNRLVPFDTSQDTSLSAAILTSARRRIGGCRQRISAPVPQRFFV